MHVLTNRPRERKKMKKKSIEFWRNHLAYLHIKLLKQLTQNECTEETKRKIKYAESILDSEE